MLLTRIVELSFMFYLNLAGFLTGGKMKQLLSRLSDIQGGGGTIDYLCNVTSRQGSIATNFSAQVAISVWSLRKRLLHAFKL